MINISKHRYIGLVWDYTLNLTTHSYILSFMCPNYQFRRKLRMLAICTTVSASLMGGQFPLYFNLCNNAAIHATLFTPIPKRISLITTEQNGLYFSLRHAVKHFVRKIVQAATLACLKLKWIQIVTVNLYWNNIIPKALQIASNAAFDFVCTY